MVFSPDQNKKGREINFCLFIPFLFLSTFSKRYCSAVRFLCIEIGQLSGKVKIAFLSFHVWKLTIHLVYSF